MHDATTVAEPSKSALADTRSAEHSAARVDELLPWNWKSRACYTGCMKFQTPVLAVVISFLSVVGASACRVGHRFPAPESLVTDDTGRIALAEVVEIDRFDGRVRYGFQRIKALRGDVPSTFTLDGDDWGEVGQNDKDFQGHRKEQYGETLMGGRTLEWTDCKVHPGFRKGFRYLVFLDALKTPWGSERIAVNDDLWLVRVRDMLFKLGQVPSTR